MTAEVMADRWINRHACLVGAVLVVLAGAVPRPVAADSALDLLSGFDAQRLEACYPVADSQSVAEMARLLFRLRKADENAIAARSAPMTADSIAGDVTGVAGEIVSVRQFKVPESLAEVLELDSFQELVLTDNDGADQFSVFAPSLVGNISEGDLIRADAILLPSPDATRALAAGRVAWIPAMAESTGWRLLARQGVDLSRVAELAARNRRVLEAADSDAFYSMLAAAKKLDTRPFDRDAAPESDRPPAPLPVEPVSLLQTPGNYHGQWIRIKASTVRITRVTVTDAARREQLGQDHYFQIDASGDLGKTIVQLERSGDDSGEPIQMSGSYPISLVAAELPDFLKQRLTDPRAVVSMISYPVSVDGFFYRLWSYQNEFMTREGGGKQVGPLIVVSAWRSLATAEEGDDGVQVIGYLMAAGIFAAIIATLWWTRRNAREDARVRESALRDTKIEI